MKRFMTLLLAVLCLVSLALPASAREESTEARNLTSYALVREIGGFGNGRWLFDGSAAPGQLSNPNAYVTLDSPDGIGSLYIIFDLESAPYAVTDNDTGKTVTCGENRFLHQFIDLEALFGECPGSVTIRMPHENIRINEISVFGQGEPPAWVQQWKEAPVGGVDLMLFPAHGGDEHLFMGGLLPYYAGELGYEVLVSYMTAHRNYGAERAHEMLNGLWAVGVTNYPVFGRCNDYETRNMDVAYAGYERRGISREMMIADVVRLLRKYHPQVVVGHDPKGETGHGMHMIYSDVVRAAVDASYDPELYPGSADEFGLWDVPKTYLHLYPAGEIVLDLDRPLEHFDGMTAYQAAKEKGFAAHASQFYKHNWYMTKYDRAADIPDYNPTFYGLYRSTVGEDVQKNDLFENVNSYEQQVMIAEEEQARLEAEEAARRQLEAEEEARKESEAATVPEATEVTVPAEIVPETTEAPTETTQAATEATETTAAAETAETAGTTESTEAPETLPAVKDILKDWAGKLRNLEPVMIRLILVSAVLLVLVVVLIVVICSRKRRK